MVDANFEIYSWGLVALSLCTDIEDQKEIEDRANLEHPTGITSKWKISKDNFVGDLPNPSSCDRGIEGRKHYLLEC